MIVVAPAVGVGFLAVGVAAYVVTSVVLSKIAKRKKGVPTPCRDTLIAAVAGVIAVVLVVLLVLVASKEWATAIWTVLTVLGFLFGFLTFALSEPATKMQTRAKYRPPASTRAPPAQEDKYRPPASTRAPPAQEDPYRKLMAKARYDQSLADRLIEYERKRMPYASLDDLCRSAIARLERDNR
jgi:hypothetical protein